MAGSQTERPPRGGGGRGALPAPVTLPLRIALFVPALVGGGISTVMLAIARGFAGRGFTVDLLVYNSQGELAGSVPDGVRLINLRARKLVTVLPGLVGYLRREQPELFIAASWYSVLPALVARTFFCRSVRTWVRQDGVFSNQIADAGYKHRTILKLIRWHLPAADAVIAVSRGVAKDLENRVPRIAGTVQVIPNPVPHDDIARQAAMPLEHPWFADPDVPVILSAGRLVDTKDYATLVRALARVRRSIYARLVILGAGRERDALTALARALGVADAVDMPGFVPNPFAYMARASVFALSSRHEGLSMVLIEAMACGTPVVSTDCPHGPGEVLENGRWGRLVPVGDADALARAILETLRDPAAPDSLVSRSRAFSIGNCIDRHVDLLVGEAGSRVRR